jgi:hypothetical protein
MNILEILAQVSLILTLAVVAWYSWETHMLRRLQIRPALILTVDLDNDAMLIRNVGSSAALNVEIPDFRGLSQVISARPNWLDFLEVGQKVTIGLRFPQGSPGMAFEAIFAKDALQILLRYQDIDGHSYETQTHVTSKGSKILYTRRVRS